MRFSEVAVTLLATATVGSAVDSSVMSSIARLASTRPFIAQTFMAKVGFVAQGMSPKGSWSICKQALLYHGLQIYMGRERLPAIERFSSHTCTSTLDVSSHVR